LRKVGWIVFGAALVFAACSGNGSTPATAPPTSAVAASNVPMTTSDLPTTSLFETTTTESIDRVAEIEAIVLDLETRRLSAVSSGDWDEWEMTYANVGFRNEARSALEARGDVDLPSLDNIALVSVVVDTVTCIAAVIDYSTTDAGGVSAQNRTTTVIERRLDGGWGISFRGEGWACDGPHPFSDS
jgi:hypothetical protein